MKESPQSHTAQECLPHPAPDVLSELPKIIQECEQTLHSKNAQSAQKLKAKILLDYEKYYDKVMKESLGKDIVCEYDVYGEYNPEMLHMDRSYRFDHNKLLQNLSILAERMAMLKKIFDKKPSIFSLQD